MFCKHEWQLLSTEVTESKFENSMRALKDASNMKLP